MAKFTLSMEFDKEDPLDSVYKDTVLSVGISNDADLDAYLEAFKAFMVSLTFPSNMVDEIVFKEGEE